MKSNIIKIILFFMFFLPTSNLKAVVKTYNLTSSSGSISACGEDYENNLTAIWNINTGILKPIIIELNLDIEEGCDFISIYSIDVNNIEHLVGTYDGYTSESIYISTILPTGKAKVVFTTDGSVCYDNGDGYWGVESYYEVDNSYNSTSSVNSVVSQNLIVSGNSYLQGNVGIGTVSPKEKLDVKGSIRGNLTGGALRIKTDYGSLDLGALNSSGTHIYTDLPRFFLNKQVQLITGELSSYNTTNLSLQTNGATRMTILNSNGNVGIGTTNPGTYKLYVNGSTYMNGTTYLNGTSNIIGDLNISKSGSYSNISQYSYSDVNWHGGRISFSRYRGTQTSPTTVLNQDYVGWFDFYGYDGAASQRVGTILIQVDGTPASGKVPGKFAIQTSNNDGVFVNRLVAYANDNIVMGLNGGKVGIGNASPNAKLEVKDGLILINGYDAVYTTNDQLGNKHQVGSKNSFFSIFDLKKT